MATRRPRRSEALHTTHRRKFKRHTPRRNHLGGRLWPGLTMLAAARQSRRPPDRGGWQNTGHARVSELGDPRDQVVALSACGHTRQAIANLGLADRL